MSKSEIEQRLEELRQKLSSMEMMEKEAAAVATNNKADVDDMIDEADDGMINVESREIALEAVYDITASASAELRENEKTINIDRVDKHEEYEYVDDFEDGRHMDAKNILKTSFFKIDGEDEEDEPWLQQLRRSNSKVVDEPITIYGQSPPLEQKTDDVLIGNFEVSTVCLSFFFY